MAANYFALPQFKVPGNAMIDFSPINNALDGMQQQQNLNRQRGDMLEQRDYQRGRDAKQDQRQDRADYRTEIDRIGKEANAIDMMNDPAQRAAAHARLIARHPNRAELTPEYLDPIKGPKLIAAEAGQFRDPMDAKMKAAELQLKYAQANKLSREASEAGAQFGKQGTIIQDRNGNFYSVQFGANGQRKVEPLQTGGPDQSPVPLQPSRGVDLMGSKLRDKATGAVIGDVSEDLQNAENVKAFGKERGEARAKAASDLPRIVDNASLALKTIDQIMAHPGKQYGVGAVGIVPGIPGTQQRGFVNLVEQMKGKTFLEAFNSLRGGGAITEAEGAKATQALARLDRAQSPADFDQAMSDLREVITIGVRRAQMSAQAGNVAGSQAPASDGWIDMGGVRIREKR